MGIATDAPEKQRGGLLSFFRELPGLILVAFGLALLIKTFLIQAFYIPSESMVPTLQVNDRVLVNKLVYDFGEPQRFDVIVFEDPISPEKPERGLFGTIGHWLTEGLGIASAQEQDYIKRVIGLPGEEIEFRGGELFIDGERLEQPENVLPTDDFGPKTVPSDHVFVMGDNRAHSDDSRGAFGPIPYDKIVGKAFVLLWPPGRLEFLSDDGS